MFLDADDILLPYAVEVLTREINRNNADVIISNFYTEKKGIGLDVYKVETNGTWLHGKIYRLSYLKENGINFLTSIRANEDSNFNMKAILTSSKVGSIQEITYLWRDIHTSITRRDTLQFFVEGVNDFIYGQIEALKFIKAKMGKLEPSLVAKVFGFIYTWYEISNERGGSPNEDLTREFLSLEDVQLQLANKSFVRIMINDQIKGNFVGYGHCIFFHEPVDVWYQRLMGKPLVGE